MAVPFLSLRWFNFQERRVLERETPRNDTLKGGKFLKWNCPLFGLKNRLLIVYFYFPKEFPVYLFWFDCSSLTKTSMSVITILVHQMLIVPTMLVLSHVNAKMDSQEMVSLVMVCFFLALFLRTRTFVWVSAFTFQKLEALILGWILGSYDLWSIFIIWFMLKIFFFSGFHHYSLKNSFLKFHLLLKSNSLNYNSFSSLRHQRMLKRSLFTKR